MNCTCLAQKISALQIQGHKFKAGTVSIRQSAMITRIHWSKICFFLFLLLFLHKEKMLFLRFYQVFLFDFMFILHPLILILPPYVNTMQICGDCLQTVYPVCACITYCDTWPRTSVFALQRSKNWGIYLQCDLSINELYIHNYIFNKIKYSSQQLPVETGWLLQFSGHRGH